MARARNIKPSFFINEQLSEIEPLGRLLFIGLWTLADYKGDLEWKEKTIKIQILPWDDCDIKQLAINLDKFGLIRFYSDGDKIYINIINFVKHQNPHKNERDKGSDIPEYSKEFRQFVVLKDITINRDLSGVLSEHSHSAPADPLKLIPDPLKLIPDSNSKTEAVSSDYAFCGDIIKLSDQDFKGWKSLYPNVDLLYELKRLDLEFNHLRPKNWFVTASQKLNYQNKQSRSNIPTVNHVSAKPSNPGGFVVVNG